MVNWVMSWFTVGKEWAEKKAEEEKAKEIAKKFEKDAIANKWGWGKWWPSEKGKD